MMSHGKHGGKTQRDQHKADSVKAMSAETSVQGRAKAFLTTQIAYLRTLQEQATNGGVLNLKDIAAEIKADIDAYEAEVDFVADAIANGVK